jgi:hypothetical protein
VSVTGWALQKLGVDTERVHRIFTKLGEIAGRVWDWISSKVSAVASKIEFDFGGAVDWIGEKLDAFLAWAEPKLDKLLDLDVSGGIQQIGEFFAAFRTRIAEFIGSPLGKLLLSLLGAWLGKKLGDVAGKNVGRFLGELAGSRRIPGSKAIAGWLGEKGGGLLGSLAGLVAGGAGLAYGSGDLAKLIAPSTSVPGRGGTSSAQVTVNQNSTITVNGTASAEQKEEFKRIVREENDSANRAAQAALVPRFSGGTP